MARQGIRPYALAVDHALNPLALSVAPGRLSWKLAGDGVPALTEIVAASSRERLRDPDLCSAALDGPVFFIDWPPGVPLRSRARVWWSVRVTSTDGVRGAWSDPATFEIPLDNADWTAQWITHPAWVSPTPTPDALPAFATTFRLDSLPHRARLYVTGLGVHETFVNGDRVGDAYLEPGYADYSVRVPASVWDVTASLRVGENLLTAVLGTGASWVVRDPERYTKLERLTVAPRYLAQLEIELENGAVVTVGTNESWDSWLGPVVSAHWYGGEEIREGGDGYAGRVRATELGTVESFTAPWFTSSAPVRVVDVVPPVSVTAGVGGTRIHDFGVNIAGQVRAELTSSAPLTAEFWPSELLGADGSVDQFSTGRPIFDRVRLSGTHTEPVRFAPSLAYHGFRYVEVSVDGGSDDAAVEVSAAVLRADLPAVGTTTTSDHYLNRLHSIIDRAVQGNMFSVFTDCPHREKLGWVEQLYLCFDVLARGYDVSAHLRQTLAHIRDAQLPSGLVPSIAPELIDFSGDAWRGDSNAFRDDPNWGSVIAHLPWRLYETYADEWVLHENWTAMGRYLGYLRTREVEGILDFGLGDWITTDESTPRAMVATYGYINALETAANVADVLRQAGAAQLYRARAGRCRSRFRDRFRARDGVVWGSGSQASFALAFDLGLVEPAHEAATFELLLESITEAHGLITVGEIALPGLLRVLTAHGRDDLVNDLIRRENGPGYGHQLASGATALTESWQGPGGPAAQGSQNHFMLGIIDDWLTGTVCGLRQAPGSVGWREVLVAPVFLDHLDWARTSFDSPTGEIAVSWERRESSVTVSATLPPGVTGTIVVDGASHSIGSGASLVTAARPLVGSAR